MKNRSFSALVESKLQTKPGSKLGFQLGFQLGPQLGPGLLLLAVALLLSGCGQDLYKAPQYNNSGRPTPPSGLLQRVLVSYTANGSQGGLEILDGLRDLRRNIQNTIPFFTITGYSAPQPTQIFNFPEQTTGYVLSQTDGSLGVINYSKETGAGSVASFGSFPASVAASTPGTRFAGASESTGQLVLNDSGGTYAFSLPNVYRVAINQGNTVILAMVRNSNTLYRIVKLPATNTPVVPPGSVDCQPLLLPTFCVVPVAGTYDRPANAYFSPDGTTAFIENCGPECGGSTAGLTLLQEGALNVDNIPTINPLSPQAPSPLLTLPVPNPIPIPGGVTTAIADGTRLYLAGQSLFSLNGGVLNSTPRADGLFTGYLTTLDLSTFRASAPISIADGVHSRMLFADDSTLWVAAQQCATGERAATGQNYNCLTRVSLAASTPTAAVVPNVTPGGSPTVAYPNTNQNLYYYGSLTGLCWVQNLHKVYTAYGGQVHAFNTADGSEIDNTNITIQGTALDVAYMDALTNSAD